MYNEVNIMVCNSCGRNNENQDANFCEYCGASLRDGNSHETAPTYNYYQNTTEGTSEQILPATTTQAIDINENKKQVSFLNWLGTYFIMLIPIVGGIVFFIMLIIWSVGNNAPESKRNWARATLTFMIIMIIISLLLILMFVMMLRDPVFQDLFNSEMNQYNDIFKDFSY